MNNEKIVKRLKLFNEKVDKLDKLSFTRRVFSEDSGYHLTACIGGEVKSERRGPDEESLDAFLLTMRHFVQNNEEISLHNMALLYDQLTTNSNIDPVAIDHFMNYRSQVKGYLDEEFTMLNMNGKIYTHGEIFFTFLYGGHAHSSGNKRTEWEMWRGNPLFFPLLENDFIVTCSVLINAVSCIRGLNNYVLKKLETG